MGNENNIIFSNNRYTVVFNTHTFPHKLIYKVKTGKCPLYSRYDKLFFLRLILSKKPELIRLFAYILFIIKQLFYDYALRLCMSACISHRKFVITGSSICRQLNALNIRTA